MSISMVTPVLLVAIGVAIALSVVNRVDKGRLVRRGQPGREPPGEPPPPDDGILPSSMRGIAPEGALAGFTFSLGGCRVCTGTLEGRPLFVLEPRLYGSQTQDFREMVETGIVPDCVDWAGQERTGRAPHVLIELWHCRGCQTGRLDFRFMTPRTLLGDAEDESQRESYDLPPEVVQNLLKAGPAEG